MYKYLLLFCLFAGRALAQISPEDFIADFESGNIADVQEVGVDSFTFEIRLDDNHGDTYGWYYFAIANSQGRTATLFLTNPDGWQNENCNPVVSPDNVHWGRVTDVWSQNGWLCFRQHLPADTIWFAQDFPFTVSQVYTYLDSVETTSYVERQTLGYSVHDRPIDMISITDYSVSHDLKKTACLISRQHPMESPPTFLLTGLIDHILGESDFADYFRRDILLKIVPIVNVDGVAEGYSRHNVNGINLNRNWQTDFESEEPEVRAVHQNIDDYINSGGSIDFFMDLHAAPDNYDFGYRMSQDYTSEPYYDEQETFLHLMETLDPWQDKSRWRDLDTSYAFGVSCVTLFDMYKLDVFSSENPWTRREDFSFINIQSLYNQGPAWAEAIYDYLYPLTVFDEYEERIDSIALGQSFLPQVRDFDRRSEAFVDVTVLCYASGDSEQVTLYRDDFEGIYLPLSPIVTNDLEAVPGDGNVSLVIGGELLVRYQEPDLPDRICKRILPVVQPTAIAESGLNIPDTYISVYPNPFNSTCTISIIDAKIRSVAIYDIAGRLVNRLQVRSGGATWDGRSSDGAELGSGIYFVNASDNKRNFTRKIVMIK
jgi:hypothetical protein